MSQAQPLVTVVTPVYNGAEYLTQCIESVLTQTYHNWEYIIVNNCSTDSSLAIAQRYARDYPRIRIHDNEGFVGVIQNHNIALRNISPQSRFCKVLQADDFLFSDCLAQMVALAEAHPSVGIVGSYTLHGVRVACDGLPYPSTVIPGREVCRLTLLGYIYPFLSPTSLLIRSDLVRDRTPYYNELYLHSDVSACYEVLQRYDFGFVHQVLSYGRRHNESITSSYSLQLNTFILSNLDLLIRYGPLFLDHTEFETRLREQTTGYYRFLARNVFRLRERRRFWRYHKDGLRNMGEPLRTSGILKGLSLEALDALLNIRGTAKNSRIARKLFGREAR